MLERLLEIGRGSRLERPQIHILLISQILLVGTLLMELKLGQSPFSDEPGCTVVWILCLASTDLRNGRVHEKPWELGSVVVLRLRRVVVHGVPDRSCSSSGVKLRQTPGSSSGIEP